MATTRKPNPFAKKAERVAAGAKNGNAYCPTCGMAHPPGQHRAGMKKAPTKRGRY